MGDCEFDAWCANNALAIADALDAKDAEIKRMRERLTHYAVMPEYDCPGDTPEICSYLCHECGQEACMASEIKHDANCALTKEPSE